MFRHHCLILRARTAVGSDRTSHLFRPSIIVALCGLIFVASATTFAQTDTIPEPPPFPESAALTTPPVTSPIDLSDARTETNLRPITPRGDSSAADRSGDSILPSPGSVLAALAFVLLLFVAASRLWKAHGPKLPGGLPREAVEVLGRCRIETRQSLYLVRLGSRILVIGSASGELRTLSEITEPTEVDLLCGQCRAQTGPSPFSRLFEARRMNEAGGHGKTNAAAVEPPPMRAAWTPAEQRLAERFRTRPAGEEAGYAA